MKMGNINWRAMGDNILKTLKQKSPEIMTGIGITGMMTTTVLAVRATPEAMRRIEQRKKEERHKKLTLVQTVQATWRCYLAPTITGAVSIFCLIDSCAVSKRRNAALVTAVGLAESSLREYRSKVIETIGEKKESAMLDSLDRDRLQRNPPPSSASQPPVAAGMVQPVLCYDALFGRYFYSDMETLKRVENKLNWQMNNMSEPYISLNEFYAEIGSVELGPVDVGDELGWRSDRGLIELRFSSQLVNGRTPCLVMSHMNPPEYGFSES